MSVPWEGDGLGPQVNKFEQVSIDYHKISVALGGCRFLCDVQQRVGGCTSLSDVWMEGEWEMRRSVQCPNASWMFVRYPPPDRMTKTVKTIFFCKLLYGC